MHSGSRGSCNRAAVVAAGLWAELAGPDPTVLELLLVRRWVNAWLGTHMAEIEAARATCPKERDALDRLLTRGRRRLESPAAFRRPRPLLTAPALAAGQGC